MTSLDKLTSLVSEDRKKPTSAMADLTSQLSALAIEGETYSKKLKVIESLRFEMIFERRRRIVEAYPTTFEWLFAERSPVELPGVSMLQWLKERNGIYWVSGKAGSGKSTLMKFLVHDERTRKALQIWAGEKRLIVASYFFWNAGTDMQKSQLGLLQTLLYAILQQCAPVVSQICPAQIQKATSSTISWTTAEILEVLNDLRLRTSDSTRFCFFIDGLDEFDGDHTELLEVMESLTSDRIKICFSSRPWNVFQNAYGANSGLKIELQDVNRRDIMRFVEGTLSKDRHFRHLKTSDNRYDDLVNEIVERASGVFLWVFLVVQSLRRGMCNSDTISELQDRLRILPTELEEYFQHILDSVEKVYHRQAARIYLICLSAKASARGILTTMSVSFFDEEAPNFALSRGSYYWNEDEIWRRTRDTSRRILARCTDLIEVSQEHEVEFLHRTVHDFLHLRDIQDLLVRRAGADFDAHQYMCNATLSQLLVPKNGGDDPQQTDNFISLVRDFLDHACEMEIHSTFTNFRLLDRLDREVGRLREEDSGLRDTGLFEKHWLVPVGVQRGLYGYLRQKIGLVRALNRRRDGNVKRPLLDFALQPRKEPLSQGKYIVSPDLKVISLLLENGADPNERYGETLVWKSFVDYQLRLSSCTKGEALVSGDSMEDGNSVDDQLGLPGLTKLSWKEFMDDEQSMDDQFRLPSHTKVTIVEMLLKHGAQFTIWDKNGHLNRVFSKLFTSKEAAHLKSIFDANRGKRQCSDSTAPKDHPSKRPLHAAVDSKSPYRYERSPTPF